MALFKRGKTWWISFTTPNGERIRCSSSTTVKNEAQELHDKLKKDTWERDRLGIDCSRTWDEASSKWLQTLEGNKSYHRNIKKLEWLSTYLGGKKLIQIDSQLIYKIANAKKEATTGANANRYIAVISAVLHKAYKWDWLYKIPSIERYRERRKRVRWLTREQYQRLQKYLPTHLKAMVQFSISTGLRQSNVKLLQWDQVDKERRVAWIHADDAKGGEAIGVPLNSDAIEALNMAYGQNIKFIFTSKSGQVMLHPNNSEWRRALAQAEIHDFRWHDLRHTWASWHVQGGTPLYVLKELGGWKTLAMVEKYAHLAPEHLATYADNVTIGVNF
jgi:integrase